MKGPSQVVAIWARVRAERGLSPVQDILIARLTIVECTAFAIAAAPATRTIMMSTPTSPILAGGAASK